MEIWTSIWISVEDRLPDKPGWYDVMFYNGHQANVPLARNLRGELKWIVPDSDVITHWKNLLTTPR